MSFVSHASPCHLSEEVKKKSLQSYSWKTICNCVQYFLWLSSYVVLSHKCDEQMMKYHKTPGVLHNSENSRASFSSSITKFIENNHPLCGFVNGRWELRRACFSTITSKAVWADTITRAPKLSTRTYSSTKWHGMGYDIAVCYDLRLKCVILPSSVPNVDLMKCKSWDCEVGVLSLEPSELRDRRGRLC